MQVSKLFAGLTAAVLALGLQVAAAQAECDPGAAATKYPALAGKTVIIGQDGESPPFSFRDPNDFEKIIGLDADLARAVFDCVGVKTEFQLGSWSGLIPAAMNGQIDLMWDTLLYTPERAQKLDFIAYMHASTGGLVVAGNPKGIKSLDDICGLKANANLGTTQEAMLRAQAQKCVESGRPDVEIITSTDMPSGLRLLDSGRADITLTNRFLADRRAAENPKLEVAFGIITDAIIAAGTAKGNTDLANAVRDGLTEVRASGAMKEIYAKYKVDYDLTMDPAILSE